MPLLAPKGQLQKPCSGFLAGSGLRRLFEEQAFQKVGKDKFDQVWHRLPVEPWFLLFDQEEANHPVNRAPERLGDQVWVCVFRTHSAGGNQLVAYGASKEVRIAIRVAVLHAVDV